MTAGLSTALSRETILALILGMAAVNFALRFVPLAALSRLRLPDWLMRWLSYIPAAVMGALMATEVLIPAVEQAQLQIPAADAALTLTSVPAVPLWANPGIYGALAAGIAFRLSKSFMGSTLAGIIVYALLRWRVGF
jgi:branched-subunit amino acid transport protein